MITKPLSLYIFSATLPFARLLLVELDLKGFCNVIMIHVYNILCDSITRPKLEAVMRFVFVLHATELSLVSGVFFIKSPLLAEKFEQSQTRSCSHLRFFSGVQYQAMLERSNFHRKYHQQLAPGLDEYKVSENTHQCQVIK